LASIYRAHIAYYRSRSVSDDEARERHVPPFRHAPAAALQPLTAIAEHLARGLVPTTVEALAFVRLVLEERPLTVYELLHASLVGEGRYSDGSGPKPRGWTEMESAAVLALCNMRVAAAAAGTVLEGVISSVGDSAGGSDE